MLKDTCDTLDAQTRACLDLWAAVFELGVLDSVDAFRTTGEFLPWFTLDDVYPGSFVWLCQLFGFCPDQARSKIRMRARVIWRNGVNARISQTKRSKANEKR